jgi:hypothetical protein
MQLRRLAKDASSTASGRCPAVYVAADDPDVMVVQGKFLDEATAGNLLEVNTDETAVRIPTETVLRAARRWLDENPGRSL